MKYILAMLIGILFISCQSKNDIVRVDLARSGAWSDHGGAISVDSSFKYNFCHNTRGPNGEQMPSYFIGKVTRQFWDTLNRKLEKINYKTVDSTDNMGGSDVSYFELIINWGNGKKHVVRMQSYNPADPVGNLINWLDTSYRHVNLKSTKESFIFQTTYQTGGLEADQMKYFEKMRKLGDSK